MAFNANISPEIIWTKHATALNDEDFTKRAFTVRPYVSPNIVNILIIKSNLTIAKNEVNDGDAFICEVVTLQSLSRSKLASPSARTTNEDRNIRNHCISAIFIVDGRSH